MHMRCRNSHKLCKTTSAISATVSNESQFLAQVVSPRTACLTLTTGHVRIHHDRLTFLESRAGRAGLHATAEFVPDCDWHRAASQRVWSVDCRDAQRPWNLKLSYDFVQTCVNLIPARYSCRSVPQIPHHSTSMRHSSGPGSGMGMSSMRTSRRPW
jgi:hypothetical protein